MSTVTATSILILGSTGSIGTQALEVIRANRSDFELVGISAAGSDPRAVVAQARDPQAARLAAERHINFTRGALKEILEAEARVEISLRRLDGGLSAVSGVRPEPAHAEQ